MSHENKNVRLVVIRHVTDLIHTNRDLFHRLVLDEELSSMNFLTVVHASSADATHQGKKMARTHATSFTSWILIVEHPSSSQMMNLQ